MLKLNLIPNAVVGDLDSLDSVIKKRLSKKNIEWVRHSKDKDKSDTELAIEYALHKGFGDIVLCGVLGRRLDHLLSNLFFLGEMSNNISLKIIEGREEIFVVRNQLRISTKKESRISLLPFKGDCQGVTTKGLKYKLCDEVLKFGYSRGLSNVATDSSVQVRLKKGILLVFHTISS